MSQPAGQSAQHPTRTLSYQDRAALPGTSTLASYLFGLIAHKRTNLCFSADVTTTRELLRMAEEVGDHICLLKTHCDHIEDFSDRTTRALVEIARRRRFLLFEDRKFLDIGSTAYKQYTKGPFRISQWADITNATIFPGPAIVTTLKEAAIETINKHNSSVKTEITVGSPIESALSDFMIEEGTTYSHNPSISSRGSGGSGSFSHTLRPPIPRTGSDPNTFELASPTFMAPRKESVVSITTTVSMKRESISPVPPSPAFPPTTTLGSAFDFPEPPFQRALLLLAQMSSADNYFTPEYTAQCVKIAREQVDFVMGFIAQESLNSASHDNFITMTPGVQLPPVGIEEKVQGTQGQQYNSPRTVVFEKGSDIIIVGRGILNSGDRRAEAERYRREGWKAYEERIGKR